MYVYPHVLCIQQSSPGPAVYGVMLSQALTDSGISLSQDVKAPMSFSPSMSPKCEYLQSLCSYFRISANLLSPFIL